MSLRTYLVVLCRPADFRHITSFSGGGLHFRIAATTPRLSMFFKPLRISKRRSGPLGKTLFKPSIRLTAPRCMFQTRIQHRCGC